MSLDSPLNPCAAPACSVSPAALACLCAAAHFCCEAHAVAAWPAHRAACGARAAAERAADALAERAAGAFICARLSAGDEPAAAAARLAAAFDAVAICASCAQPLGDSPLGCAACGDARYCSARCAAAEAAAHALVCGADKAAVHDYWRMRAACASDPLALDGTAAFTLALHFDHGVGVERSAASAFEWYSRGAALGHPDAIASKGAALIVGRGVARDVAAGRAVRAQAVGASTPEYKLKCGIAHLHGHVAGLPRDERLAFRLLSEAARELAAAPAPDARDLAEARLWLAECFRRGAGTAADLFSAAELYEQAAEAGCVRAMPYLAAIYEHGDGYARDARRAALWYERAAEGGDAESMRQTGINYETGRGVAADGARALHWYLKGADAGDVGCTHNAAVHLFEGRGGARDAARAFELFSRAAAAGSAPSLLGLYGCRRRGLGTPRDERGALAHLVRAAEGGVVEALAEMGLLHLTGECGVRADAAEAARWLRRAADAGDAKSCGLLGALLRDGVSAPADARAAAELFRRGAEAGCAASMVEHAAALLDGAPAAADAAADRRAAAAWMRRAAAAGHGAAADFVARLERLPEGAP